MFTGFEDVRLSETSGSSGAVGHAGPAAERHGCIAGSGAEQVRYTFCELCSHH